MKGSQPLVGSCGEKTGFGERKEMGNIEKRDDARVNNE